MINLESAFIPPTLPNLVIPDSNCQLTEVWTNSNSNAISSIALPHFKRSLLVSLHRKLLREKINAKKPSTSINSESTKIEPQLDGPVYVKNFNCAWQKKALAVKLCKFYKENLPKKENSSLKTLDILCQILNIEDPKVLQVCTDNHFGPDVVLYALSFKKTDLIANYFQCNIPINSVERRMVNSLSLKRNYAPPLSSSKKIKDSFNICIYKLIMCCWPEQARSLKRTCVESILSIKAKFYPLDYVFRAVQITERITVQDLFNVLEMPLCLDVFPEELDAHLTEDVCLDFMLWAFTTIRKDWFLLYLAENVTNTLSIVESELKRCVDSEDECFPEVNLISLDDFMKITLKLEQIFAEKQAFQLLCSYLLPNEIITQEGIEKLAIIFEVSSTEISKWLAFTAALSNDEAARLCEIVFPKLSSTVWSKVIRDKENWDSLFNGESHIAIEVVNELDELAADEEDEEEGIESDGEVCGEGEALEIPSTKRNAAEAELDEAEKIRKKNKMGVANPSNF